MIEITGLTKDYVTGDVVTHVLRGIDLSVRRGEFLAIMGKSGAGKSTLMYQMGLLDHPTGGSIVIDGQNINELSSNERTEFRLMRLGYVFQDYALVPELTAVENVIVPLMMQGLSRTDALVRAERALDQVGLKHKFGNLPSQLSGGEQQRVSIARATAQDPSILFADEPTANLDSTSSEAVLDVLNALHAEGQTIVMVTHEKEYTRDCERIVFLEDGQIVEEEILEHNRRA